MRTFDDATALLPEVIADTLLEERHVLVGDDDARTWFKRHCDLRLRWLFANKPYEYNKLKGRNGRDHAYKLVGHWLDGLLFNQRAYRDHHPHNIFEG